MQIDIFTKFILTAIAIALWGLMLKPIIFPTVVGASSSIIDVNLKEVGGKRVYDSVGIDIKKVNGKIVYNEIPVVVK